MKNFISVGLCLVLLIFVGCATVDYSFVNMDARVASEKKVAVVPFAVAIDDYAALRVSVARKEAAVLVNSIFMKELARHTKYNIISPYEVTERLSLDKEKLNWLCKNFLGDPYERRGLTSERLSELGDQLDAQAILIGKVTDFSRYQQNGILWTGIGLTVKMIDVKSGEVLWEARDKIKDVSTITHSFSTLETNGDFPYHIDYKNTTLKLCQKIISTLPRY